MKKMPKISIIIPIYNVENYLSQCLDSVIKQTLYDIEIICVNDGTKDDSVYIARKYQEYDNRIQIIEKQNGGLSSARNAGIKIASGAYIIFLDSDDYLASNACERLYQEILEVKPDIITFGSHYFPIYPHPGEWLVKTLSPRTHTYNQFSEQVLFKERGAYPFVWRQCFKREFLREYGLLFDETVKFGEDLVFQFCSFPYAKRIVFLADKLYYYRWYRENSLMFNASQKLYEKYKQHINLIDIIVSCWDKNGFLQEYKDMLFNWSLEFMGYDLKKYADKKAKKDLIQELFSIWEKHNFLLRAKGLKNKRLLLYLKANTR